MVCLGRGARVGVAPLFRDCVSMLLVRSAVGLLCSAAASGDRRRSQRNGATVFCVCSQLIWRTGVATRVVRRTLTHVQVAYLA